MNKKYHKALVIFIDILGSQNRVDFDALYKVNSIFHNQLENNKQQDKSHTAYERHIHTFSDCSYIIYDFKDNVDESRKDLQKLFNVALYNTQTLIQQFLFEGFICRGGIAYDDVYYETTRSLLFGPAINSAYRLESKVAIYPRIVLDPFVAEQVILFNKTLLDNAPCQEQRDMVSSINGDIVLKDNDENYYLNYLCSVKQGLDFVKGEELISRLKQLIAQEIEVQQNAINSCTEETKKEVHVKILDKYIWLSKYVESSMPTENLGGTLSYIQYIE